MLTVAQLAPLKERDPYLYETLVKVVSAVNATSQCSGVDPSAPSPVPTPIASLTVRAANGWFDLAVTDPTQRTARAFLHSKYPQNPQSPRDSS
jgi:hypothetical protein